MEGYTMEETKLTSIEIAAEQYSYCWKSMMIPWRYEKWMEEINHIDYPEFAVEAQEEE